ncbi:MAG: hypothetical protein ACP6IY_05320 [Promethearchaeia archaeon]
MSSSTGNEEKIKKKVKNSIKSSIRKRKEKLVKKINKFKLKLREFFFGKEIYIKGKEMPKYYSFDKRFTFLYFIFLYSSLVIIMAIAFPENIVFKLLTFGNPFYFGNAVIAFLLTLSFFLNIDSIREFIFEDNSHFKQIIIFPAIIIGYFLLFNYVLTTELNFITYLMFLSMIWLVLLSTRFYSYSRKFATKIESIFISKYSIFRYFLALIIPFIIMVILVIIALFYRTFIVFIAIDFLGPNDPTNAVKVYSTEMTLVMPLIYLSLILTFLFIIFEFIITRSRAETKRAGTFDNFTFSLIVFFIFLFQIFQITIFLLNREETIQALRNTVGATSNTVWGIFLAEFAISMFFLYRIIIKLGGTFGWRVLFFKKDGLILFFLACVLAQTLIRYTLKTGIEGQEIAGLGVFLSFDRYIISILMIIFLGLTLLIYYIKPHETSMFMRLQKETVKKEDKSMERIYKMLKAEYIRRGEPYPIEILEKELIKATHLSKGVVYSLIQRIAEKDINVEIENRKIKDGHPQKYINFLSITETFEKKDIAKKKAQKYLSERLVKTISSQKRKTIRLTKDKLKEDKASDIFISHLTSDYRKKQIDEEKINLKRQQLSASLKFKDDTFKDVLKNTVLSILKKEYRYRIENPNEYEDFRFPISEVALEIQNKTKLTPGDLYPFLNDLSKKDIELRLIDNPVEPEDKKIEFFPISDDAICNSLANFRLEYYNEIKKEITELFLVAIKRKKGNYVLSNLKEGIMSNTEIQKTWKELIERLYKYFPKYHKRLTYVPNWLKLRETINKMKKNK